MVPASSLHLQRTLFGWALVSGSGETVYRAYGPWARERCLAHVRRMGMLRF